MKHVKISVVFSLCLFFIFELCGCSIMKTDMDTYSKMAVENDVMPTVNELGKYEDLKIKNYSHNMLFFNSEAYTVIAKYDDKEFEKQKAGIESNYKFSKDIIEFDVSDSKLKPEFTLDGFEFRVLSEAYSEYGFPKDMYFIGINEDERKIAYIYFHDFDLDYIDSFEEFLIEDCGWEK